jgi:hypothetical protein
MFLVEDIKRQVTKNNTSGIVTQLSKDNSMHLALEVALAVYLFCIHSLRVMRPGGFGGESPQHNIDCCRDKWRILIVLQEWCSRVLFLYLHGLCWHSSCFW